jgi:hypothetical protein
MLDSHAQPNWTIAISAKLLRFSAARSLNSSDSNRFAVGANRVIECGFPLTRFLIVAVAIGIPEMIKPNQAIERVGK